MSSRARRSVRHFPVGGGGRWRHVPVVDTGCGCRPRRPRQLLMSLPSFLRPSPKPRSGGGGGSQYSSSSFFPSSASTASFSSSSAATYSCSSSTNNGGYYSSNVYKPPQPQPPPPQYKAARPSPPVARKKRSRVKKRYEKMEAAAEGEEGDDVGVAVEKESSDPRADFRESMVQMVVEMGLCDWNDLRCMLRRLLALNAPRHHAAILTAFAEVCAQLTAPPAPPPPPPVYHHHYHY